MPDLEFAIVEDDEADAQLLSSLVEDFFQSKGFVCKFSVFPDAESFLKRGAVGFDTVFLDMYLLGEINGMQVAERIRDAGSDVPIVFITSSPDMVFSGYRVRAFAYLLKPVKPEELNEALERIVQRRGIAYVIQVSDGRSLQSVDVRNVAMCRAANHRVRISMANPQTGQVQREVEARITFSDLANMLKHFPQFYSSARGWLVNLDYVTAVEGCDYILKNGDTVPIAQQSLQAARRAYNDYVFFSMRKDFF